MSYARPRTLPAELHVPDGRVIEVRVDRLGSSRAFVEGLTGHVIKAGSDVVLMLEDVEGPLPIAGRLDWIANRSGVRLFCPTPARLRRLHRIIVELDALGVAASEDDERELG